MDASGPTAAAEAAEEERICRYCFEGEEEDGELVAPCRCTGGQKWVHLACLQRWQRGVLAALPSRTENRQRICNICCSRFSVRPPTHLEILTSYIGAQFAELIAEGSLICARSGFSRTLRRQLASLPAALRDTVAHRHWIRGAFLIVRIASGSPQTVPIRIETAEDLEAFSRRVEDGWGLELHGQSFRIALDEWQLAGAGVPEDADATRARAALLALQLPVTLTIYSAGQPDGGEDGVTAVNLTRIIDVRRPAHRYKRVVFLHAKQQALERFGEDVLGRVEVEHLLGGPCEEDDVGCCLVVTGTAGEAEDTRLNYAIHDDLDHAWEGAVTDAATPATSSKASAGTTSPAPRLLVFWGHAGWTRRQLLGEAARGSWGLCRAEPQDIAAFGQRQLWEVAGPRLAIPPTSELSEGHALDAEDTVGESDEELEDGAASGVTELRNVMRRLLTRRRSSPRSGSRLARPGEGYLASFALSDSEVDRQ